MSADTEVFAISAVSSAKSTKNFEDTAKDLMNVELHQRGEVPEDSGALRALDCRRRQFGGQLDPNPAAH